MSTPETQPPLVSRARLGAAVGLALLSAAFNVGTQIRTLTDAAVWVAVAVPLAYVVFTVLGLLADGIRGR